MEVILKLFLITSWKHFNFAMHHWYKQFILQMLCRDKEADPCSLQSLRKCSGMKSEEAVTSSAHYSSPP